MSEISPALSQIRDIYTQFETIQKKAGGIDSSKAVQVFFRVRPTKKNRFETQSSSRHHTIKLEQKNRFRKFLISITGAQDQYRLEKNIDHFATLIQQGIEALARGEGNTEDVDKVAACFSRYQEIINNYAQKHSERNKKFQHQEFLNIHLQKPINDFLENLEAKEQEIKKWENDSLEGKSLFARYALKLIEKTKSRATCDKVSAIEKIYTLCKLSLFLNGAVVQEVFLQSSFSVDLERLGQEISQDSPLRKDYKRISQEWESLQTPLQDFSCPLDSVKLLEYLEQRFNQLHISLAMLKLKTADSQVINEAKHHCARKILSHFSLVDKGPLIDPKQLPQGMAEFIEEASVKVEEESDTENLKQRLEALLKRIPKEDGPWTKTKNEATQLMGELETPLQTGPKEVPDIDTVLTFVRDKRRELGNLLKDLEGNLKQKEEEGAAPQTIPEDLSAVPEEEGPPLEDEIPEPETLGNQSTVGRSEQKGGESRISYEVSKKALAEAVELFRRKHQLSARIAKVREKAPPASSLQEPLLQLSGQLEESSTSADLSSIEGKVRQLEAKAEEEVELAEAKRIEEQSAAKASARKKIPPLPLESKIGEMQQEILKLAKQIQSEHPDEIGVNEIIEFAERQAKVKRNQKTALEELLSVHDVLRHISRIFDFSPQNEKASQLRLWSLRALCLSVQREAIDKQCIESIISFCKDASEALDTANSEKGVDIEEAVASIDEIFKDKDIRSGILAKLHGEKIYALAKYTLARLSDPIEETIGEPTRWARVSQQFYVLRLPAEKIEGLHQTVLEIERLVRETETQKDALERELDGLATVYQPTEGVKEAVKFCKALISYTSSELSVKDIQEWHTRIGTVRDFVNNLQQVLAPPQRGREDQRQLVQWMMFGIASAQAQYALEYQDATFLSHKLLRFSEEAKKQIQGPEPSSEGWFELIERLETRNAILRDRGEKQLTIPQVSKRPIPDFDKIGQPLLLDPLDWKQITQTWKEQLQKQKEAYAQLDSSIAIAEVDSPKREQTVKEIFELSRKLRDESNPREILDRLDASSIQSLIPSEKQLMNAPMDRLEDLSTLLHGIVEYVDILLSKAEPLEYQQKVAKLMLSALTSILLKQHEKVTAAGLLRPMPQEKLVDEIQDTQTSEGGLAPPHEDLLSTLSSLMEVKGKVERLEGEKQRNISRELSDIKELFGKYQDLLSPILKQTFVITTGKPGQSITKTGEEILDEIKSIASKGFSSLSELRADWTQAVAYLKIIYDECDAALQKKYAERMEMAGEKWNELSGAEESDWLVEQLPLLKNLKPCGDAFLALPDNLEEHPSQNPDALSFLDNLLQVEKTLDPIASSFKQWMDDLESRYKKLEGIQEQIPKQQWEKVEKASKEFTNMEQELPFFERLKNLHIAISEAEGSQPPD
jgi:hypothetical protein